MVFKIYLFHIHKKPPDPSKEEAFYVWTGLVYSYKYSLRKFYLFVKFFWVTMVYEGNRVRHAVPLQSKCVLCFSQDMRLACP